MLQSTELIPKGSRIPKVNEPWSTLIVTFNMTIAVFDSN